MGAYPFFTKLAVFFLFLCSCAWIDTSSDVSTSVDDIQLEATKEPYSQQEMESEKESASKAPPSKPIKPRSDAWVSDVLASHRQLNAVKTTASGLQYVIKKRGHGKSAKFANKVRVNYELKLSSTGKVLESSLKNGRPSDLLLQNLIRGWQEGIRLMLEGDVTEFVIPPKLAYGRKGLPPKIKSNEVLVLQVELLKVLR